MALDDWLEQAACRNKPVEWWFPDKEGSHHAYARARLICNACPVSVECLNYAIDNRIMFGMFGGRSAKERDEIRRVSGGGEHLLQCRHCGGWFMHTSIQTKWCSRRCKDDAGKERLRNIGKEAS